MNILESLYENKINFPTIYDRKVTISAKKTFLYGPKLVGKTSIIWNYLKEVNEDYLYIDLDDFRYEKEELFNIESFLDKNKIKICVIENYTEGFPIPNVEEIILSSIYYVPLENFTPLKVMPLDFEEYLLFDTKHQNTTNSFNSFLKYGNIPEIIEYKDYKKSTRNKELIKLYDGNSSIIEILKLCIKSSGELKSPFWLFNILKKKIKISKDFFYKTMKELENNHTIVLCPKYDQPNAVKKIFCFNFALIDIVSSKKNFANLFANMIFLELFNQNKSIYYLDYVDFYTPHNNTILISLPFYNNHAISNILPKILEYIEKYKIKKITIVTISNFDSIFIDKVEAQIVPFYEWALGK
ncbi:MAG: ATP-binding protein [Epsilonproteobacteria bacterium]|nr:ATP-binding protein [Campylobacterota bacterium]